MSEKRSLFAKIFGALRGVREMAQLRVLSGYTPVFSPWSGQPYEADVVRAAVDAIARNGAKLRAKHVRRQGTEILHVGGEIERILSVKPNANMRFPVPADYHVDA
jgi:hypothetical protein